ILAIDLPLPDSIKIAQQVLSPQRRLVEAGFHRDQLVVDDVAQPPVSALPGLDMIPASLLRVITERVLLQLFAANVDRSREPHAGRFGQDPQPAMKRLVVPRRGP